MSDLLLRCMTQQSVPPMFGGRTPAPWAAGLGEVEIAHVQMLGREVKRLEWRKIGLADSAEEAESISPSESLCDSPKGCIDDIFDR